MDGSQAIVAWAEQQTTKQPPAHTPAYKRLTDTDRVLILRYDKDGLTQTEIAQRLGCDQSSVSRWLATCRDSSAEAIAYTRGRALHTVRRIHRDGKPSDLIAMLKGAGVLESEQQKGLTVNINGVVLAGMGQPPSPQSEVIEGESVRIT